MNTSQLKPFAQNARRQLLEVVSTKAAIVLDADSAARRENPKAVKDLEKEIARTSEKRVIEKVAYIWFNRFCALRFMDVNRYTSIGVVSPAPGFSQPEILMEAKQGHIDPGLDIDPKRVFGLLNETIPSPEPQQEAYRLLLAAVCNDYNRIMPFLFAKIADYTELLMPDDLLSDSSVLTATREALSQEACTDVEVIGWLYQFYISEKKDAVFAGLKKNQKVTPENIPAATQLFTPNWIVRYLVENSLGRLWMLNHPESGLIEQMEYYIRPEQEETDFLRIHSPEEIKICDPACGSGHILVYAFELLYAIYEEQGYDAPQIPQLILTNNLYGIEIDERAGELAAFALCMKARSTYRRFFKKKVQPHICVLENVTFAPNEVKRYFDAVNPALLNTDLATLLYQFEEADNFGSLIRPEVTNISDVIRLLDENKVADDMFLRDTHERVLKVLNQAEHLRPKYHVVIANPPYMGGKGMNARLGSWLKDNYKDVKSDLFSAFIVRNAELAITKGQLGFMSPFVWMFISTYEKLRNFIINEKTITSLIQLEYSGFDGATVPICTFTLENDYNPKFRGGYVRLSDFRGSESQASKTLEAINNNSCEWFYSASSKDFGKVPGRPIAYWISDSIRNLFIVENPISEKADARAGLQTSDNKRFLRIWSEINFNKVGFGFSNRKEAQLSRKKWFPCNKGGPYRKWYGNWEYVVNWYNDGEELFDFARSLYGSPTRIIKNADYYFKEGITWSDVTSGKTSFRYSPEGCIFDATGHSAFFNSSDEQFAYLAYLNLKLINQIVDAINPTLHFHVGYFRVLPSLSKNILKHKQIAIDAIKIACKDWNSYETSWDFSELPLIKNLSFLTDGNIYANKHFPNCRLDNVYKKLRADWQKLTLDLHHLEQENNSSFNEAYDLQEELDSNVPLSEITINCNPYYRYPNTSKKKYSKDELESFLLIDTIKELISYSVGCMFGRYSLDKPGLILANQGETIETFLAQIPNPTFKPDDDNVIPIMDVDWFPDDMVERFKRFLKVTFGEEHYSENLAFIEKAIGKEIRKFFLKDFYPYHVKMYKKRPIYWMFSSPRGSFNVLIYMHRYRPDTVSVVLNDYLREFRTKLAARKDNLESVGVSPSAAPREKTKALKEDEKLKKVLDEIDQYERDTLYPLATQQIEIDLDDGVKVNYPKFGKALKKVAGLS